MKYRHCYNKDNVISRLLAPTFELFVCLFDSYVQTVSIWMDIYIFFFLAPRSGLAHKHFIDVGGKIYLSG